MPGKSKQTLLRVGRVLRKVVLKVKQGEVEEVKYIKTDDGLKYFHVFSTNNEMWLVEVGHRRGLLILPKKSGGSLWERDSS